MTNKVTKADKVNKVYINILTVLILGLLGVKVLLPAIGVGSSFGTNNHKLTETHTPFEVLFSSDAKELFAPTDEITFESGETYSIIEREAYLFVPDEMVPKWVRWTSVICYMIVWVVLAFAFYEFIRFVININRMKIFVPENAKRLWCFGWLLIAVAVLYSIAGLAEEYLIYTLHLSHAGRSLESAWEFPWTSLLVGLASMLIARIWRRGIMLREDSELTI